MTKSRPLAPFVIEAVRAAMIREAKRVNHEPARPEHMRRASRGRIALVLKVLEDAGFRVYIDGRDT